MTFGFVQDMPGATERHYRLIESHLGPRPAGLIGQVAGPTDEGWRIVAVWESEDDHRRFVSEQLMRAVGIAAQEDWFDPALASGFRTSGVTGDDFPQR